MSGWTRQFYSPQRAMPMTINQKSAVAFFAGLFVGGFEGLMAMPRGHRWHVEQVPVRARRGSQCLADPTNDRRNRGAGDAPSQAPAAPPPDFRTYQTSSKLLRMRLRASYAVRFRLVTGFEAVFEAQTHYRLAGARR